MARNGNTTQPSIRRYRIRKRLTQQELADAMGIDRATLGRLESFTSSRHLGRKLARIVAETVGKTTGQIIDEYERRQRRAY